MTSRNLEAAVLVVVLAGAFFFLLDRSSHRGTATRNSTAAAATPKKKADAGGKPRPNPAIGGSLTGDSKTTGTITGVILFKGKKPEMKPLVVKKDHKDAKICGASVPYERHIIGAKNELANAVVSIASKSLPRGKPREIGLTNSHCRFVPHVQATTVHSKLIIGSEDPTLHSALCVGSASFNVAIPNTSTKVSKRLSREGWIICSCSTHSWMNAWIWVFRHDYFAVTGTDGKFTLRGLPPGEYTLDFWHEMRGLTPRKTKVTVKAGEKTRVTLELEPLG